MALENSVSDLGASSLSAWKPRGEPEPVRVVALAAH